MADVSWRLPHDAMQHQSVGRDSHDNEDRADDDALHAPAENRIGYDGKRLVHDHICQQEGHQEQMSIFADGHDLGRVALLLTGSALN